MGLRAEDFSPALHQFKVFKGGKFCEMTADVLSFSQFQAT